MFVSSQSQTYKMQKDAIDKSLNAKMFLVCNTHQRWRF